MRWFRIRFSPRYPFVWSPAFLQGGEITGGIDNLFDRAPPADPFFEGWPLVNRALHDNRGRFGCLEYRHSW